MIVPEEDYTIKTHVSLKNDMVWHECIITHSPTGSVFYGAGSDNLIAQTGAFEEMKEALS